MEMDGMTTKFRREPCAQCFIREENAIGAWAMMLVEILKKDPKRQHHTKQNYYTTANELIGKIRRGEEWKSLLFEIIRAAEFG